MDEIALRDDAFDRRAVGRNHKCADAVFAEGSDCGLNCRVGPDRKNVAALVLQNFSNLHIVVSLKRGRHGIHNATGIQGPTGWIRWQEVSFANLIGTVPKN